MIIETRLGDRLDLLAVKYLNDATLWERIAAANPTLSLTAGFYLSPGIFVKIPNNEAEKIPDLLPWDDTTEGGIFEPIELPPDLQPGAAVNEILTGAGWLPPAAVRILIGAIAANEVPPSVLYEEIGVIVPPLVVGKVPIDYLPAYPTIESLGGLKTSDIGQSVPSLINTKIPIGQLPAYPTIGTLGAISTNAIGVSVPNLILGKIPIDQLPAQPSPITLPLAISQGGTAGKSPTLLEPRSNAVSVNANTLIFDQFAASKMIDNNAGNSNFPNDLKAGYLEQIDPLFGTANAGKNRIQRFIASDRVWIRSENSNVWGSWVELATSGGAIFSTATAPKIDSQNTGITRSGVNFSAPAQSTNQKQARINYETNGNISLQILSDDGSTVLNQWIFTASGNLLVPGVMRFAGYASNPTGASFVPGGIYYNTTLGTLGVSNGTNWYRITLGSQIT